jgi:hypothetical protein
MIGFLRRLFGGSSGGAEEPPAADAVEYKGFRIRPAPFKAEGQFQTAGIIEKDSAEGLQEHHFVRAEKHASQDEAASFAITKAKQIIDERGDRMFEKR